MYKILSGQPLAHSEHAKAPILLESLRAKVLIQRLVLVGALAGLLPGMGCSHPKPFVPQTPVLHDPEPIPEDEWVERVTPKRPLEFTFSPSAQSKGAVLDEAYQRLAHDLHRGEDQVRRDYSIAIKTHLPELRETIVTIKPIPRRGGAATIDPSEFSNSSPYPASNLRSTPEAQEQREIEQSIALANTINRYRHSLGLKPIPLSKSLSTVAMAHARDLALNNPTNGIGCNLHSWSDQQASLKSQRWTGCCYTENHAQAKCMHEKPRELTLYPGNGYEISASGVSNPVQALKMWIESPLHHETIQNQGKWRKPWQAIGAGMYKGFAVVWFGNEPDPDR